VRGPRFRHMPGQKSPCAPLLRLWDHKSVDTRTSPTPGHRYRKEDQKTPRHKRKAKEKSSVHQQAVCPLSRV